jgi:hypothetical protein
MTDFYRDKNGFRTNFVKDGNSKVVVYSHNIFTMWEEITCGNY